MPYCTPPSEYISVKNGPASPKIKPDLAVKPEHELYAGAELPAAAKGSERCIPAALEVDLAIVAGASQESAVRARR